MTARPDIAIARLRQVRAAAEAGKPIPANIAAWLIDALGRYERDAPDGLDLDRALGLVPEPGNDAWWTAEARQRRDDTIRTLHDRHFADLRITQSAREIAKLERRNRGVVRREAGEPRIDERKVLLREARSTGLPFPGRRQIENILRNGTSVLIS